MCWSTAFFLRYQSLHEKNVFGSMSSYVNLCTEIRSSKYIRLINVQLFNFITKSLNKLYIGLFVARSSDSLEIENFLVSILFIFFLKFRKFWPKYLGTMEKYHDFIRNHHKNYFAPLPPINVEKLSRQHIWQLCKHTLQH